MRELWRRLWFLLNRSRSERELREEMDAHRAAMITDAGVPFGNSLRRISSETSRKYVASSNRAVRRGPEARVMLTASTR